MTYVVTDACVKCKHTDCVEVCPVDCFKEGPLLLVIDPVECIDCNLCVTVCPIGAIFPEAAVPLHMMEYIELNAKLARSPDFVSIKKKQDPLPEHTHWANINNKRQFIA